jgi:signal peptidase I
MRIVLRYIVWTMFIAGCIVGLARATAIRWWQIPLDDPWLAASVAPTLRPGDWVILWRLTRPVRGDLVKCPEPQAPERVVIGRILGALNDEIAFDKGELRLNGRGLPVERGCPEFEVLHPKTNEPIRQSCRVEELEHHGLYSRGGLVAELPAPPSMKSTAITSSQYFLVSDNRQFPLDSRDYGTIESSTCRESIIFRLWGKGGYFQQEGRFEVVQ